MMTPAIAFLGVWVILVIYCLVTVVRCLKNPGESNDDDE